MMTNYLVTWEIDTFDARTPLDAALNARAAQIRPGTTATVFTVTDKSSGASFSVDLDEGTTNRISN